MDPTCQAGFTEYKGKIGFVGGGVLRSRWADWMGCLIAIWLFLPSLLITQGLRNLHPRNNWQIFLKNCPHVCRVAAVDLHLGELMKELTVFHVMKAVSLTRCSFPTGSLSLSFERYGWCLQSLEINSVKQVPSQATLIHQVLLKAAQCRKLTHLRLADMSALGLDLHSGLLKNIPSLVKLQLAGITGMKTLVIESESLQSIQLEELKDVTEVTINASQVPSACIFLLFLPLKEPLCSCGIWTSILVGFGVGSPTLR